MRKIYFILALVLFAATAHPATYYMRSDGTAANKGAATSCSAASTAMSISTHNSESFSSADIVTLCDDGSDYTDTLNTPSDGVTYTVAVDDSVSFNGVSSNAIVVDRDTITFQKGSGTLFEVKNCGGSTNMILVHDAGGSASNIVFDHLTIGPDQKQGAFDIQNADNVTIKHCYLWNTDDNDDSGGEHISISSSAYNIYVEYCDFKGDTYAGDAFVIGASAHDVHIRYNKFHDWTFDGCGWECSEQFIDIKDDAYNIYIYGNLFDTTVNYQAIIVHNANSYGTIHGIYIYGNFFTDNNQGSINIWARYDRDIYDVFIFSNIFFEGSPNYAVQITGGGSGEPSNFHIFNNTILDSSSTADYPIDLSDGDEAQGSNSVKNNIVENNLTASSRRLLYNNGVPPVTTTYGRWYDADGTAKCYDDGGTERDCDDETNFGIYNEVGQTAFINRTNGADLSTNSNLTPADNLTSLCAVCDYGIKEGYDFSSLGVGDDGSAVELVERGNFNSGVWGKGAVIYGSAQPAGPKAIEGLKLY